MIDTTNQRDMRTEAEIKLAFPIDFDGEHITSLTIRRPKVRDNTKARAVKGDDMDRGLALIANLIERPVELMQELDEVDLESLNAQYMAFTGRQNTTPEI